MNRDGYNPPPKNIKDKPPQKAIPAHPPKNENVLRQIVTWCNKPLKKRRKSVIKKRHKPVIKNKKKRVQPVSLQKPKFEDIHSIEPCACLVVNKICYVRCIPCREKQRGVKLR